METLGKDEIKELYLAGYQNPAFFCRWFLPEWFTSEDTKTIKFPWFQIGLMAMLTKRTDFILQELDEESQAKLFKHFAWKLDPEDKHEEPKPIFKLINGKVQMVVKRDTVIVLPRGFAKTTITNAMVIYMVCYGLIKFPLYVSHAAPHAEAQLNNIKTQLGTNARIQAVFGALEPPRNSPLKWRDDIFQTLTGIVCAARGSQGQVRGLNVNSVRPDLVIVDDLEDQQEVKNEENRKSLKAWVFGSLTKVLPRMDTNARLIFLGTLLHRDALLLTLMRNPKFLTVKFACIDPDGDPLWPESMSLAQIEAERLSHQSAGELNQFYLEYFNEVRNEETAKFKQSQFKYNPPGIHVARAIAIDPAISEKKTADFSAIAVVGIQQGGIIDILDIWAERGVDMRTQADNYFRLVRQWQPDKHGVESIAYQAALVGYIRERMFREKQYFEVIPIGHSTKKTERVEGILRPRYSAGYINHVRHFPIYESQLLNWPEGKKDCPDVVSMAISLLQPYAAAAADPDIDLGTDEYEPLSEEYRRCP